VPTSATGKRLVVAYASNPLTNGNGTNQSGTAGNHTPQDVWVGADDNTSTHASQLVGKGLLDNTSLTPIMANVLGLTAFEQGSQVLRTAAPAAPMIGEVQLSPMPFDGRFQVQFEVPALPNVRVELLNELGQRVRTALASQTLAAGLHTVAIDGTGLSAGFYVAAVTING